MLSITHMATGAIIAHYLPQPLFYVPLTLASHYLEDYLPHWDCGTGLDQGKNKLKAVGEEIVELILAVIFIYITFEQNQPGIQFHIWLAVGLSLLPDFMEAPSNFLDWNPRLLKPLNGFHDRFHNTLTDPITGLTPQLLLIFVIYLAS